MSASAVLAVVLAASAAAGGLSGPGVAARRLRRLGHVSRARHIAGPFGAARIGRTPAAAGAVRDGHPQRTGFVDATAGRTVRVSASAAQVVAAVGALGLGLTVVGGPAGLLVGVGAGVAVVAVLRRGEPAADRAVGVRLAAELPAVADLVAACLDCGTTPAHAVRCVAEAFGSPWRERLLPPLDAIALGADPWRAWHALSVAGATAPLADVLARGSDDGVALVPLLRALATERRRRLRADARRRAQRVGVLALGPLAACFLPAFVVVGVVPVVVSVGRAVLGGLL